MGGKPKANRKPGARAAPGPVFARVGGVVQTVGGVGAGGDPLTAAAVFASAAAKCHGESHRTRFKRRSRRFCGWGSMFIYPAIKTAQNAFKCDFRRCPVFGHRKTGPRGAGPGVILFALFRSVP